MRSFRFYTADVFTDSPFGGNPLAVFPGAAGLTSDEMQKVAKEFNLSETVFVLPPQDPSHTRRVRIFTPGRELPFAGHPTVGAAHVLAAIGDVSVESDETTVILEEGVGPVSVLIRATDGRPTFCQLSAAMMPEYGPPPPAEADIARLLSIEAHDLDPAAAPAAVSCGLPYLCVQLRDRDSVARARLRLEVWDEILSSYWAKFVYLYAFDPELPGSDLHARMFAHGVGVAEDPATGSAATALAGLLAARHPDRDATLRWLIEQGFEMGRPSFISAEADKSGGEVVAVRVGGPSVMMSEGRITLG